MLRIPKQDVVPTLQELSLVQISLLGFLYMSLGVLLDVTMGSRRDWEINFFKEVSISMQCQHLQ